MKYSADNYGTNNTPIGSVVFDKVDYLYKIKVDKSKFLECNGQQLYIDQHKELYNVVGDMYSTPSISEDAEMFCLPKLNKYEVGEYHVNNKSFCDNQASGKALSS